MICRNGSVKNRKFDLDWALVIEKYGTMGSFEWHNAMLAMPRVVKYMNIIVGGYLYDPWACAAIEPSCTPLWQQKLGQAYKLWAVSRTNCYLNKKLTKKNRLDIMKKRNNQIWRWLSQFCKSRELSRSITRNDFVSEKGTSVYITCIGADNSLGTILSLEAINIRDNTWRDFTRARSDHWRAELRAKLHLSRKQVKRTVKNAEDLWLEKMCAEAEQKGAFQAWDAMKTRKQGFYVPAKSLVMHETLARLVTDVRTHANFVEIIGPDCFRAAYDVHLWVHYIVHTTTAVYFNKLLLLIHGF